jgi:hypothetical protein
MAQNQNSQWPKAIVAVLGTAAISAAAYLLKEPDVMWSMFLLLFLVERFD